MSRFFFVAVALTVGSLFAVSMIEESGVMTASKAPARPVARKPVDPGTVTIAARNGHYTTDALVDGREIAFMVDTGATLVALRESDAADLGYRPREQDYNVKISTANGEGRAARIELGTVEIGDITVRNVPAAVSEPGKLSTSLLGMSFLSRLQRVDMRSGVLVLQE